MFWRPVLEEEVGNYFEKYPGVKAASDADFQTLARELINDAKHAKRFAVTASIHDEVITPNMILMRRTQSNT